MKHMDYIYLKDNYYKDKKEIFSFIIDILKKKNKENYSLIDLGCARGELLYHIKNEMPNYSELYGLDYSSQLIESAQESSLLEDINFEVGDAQNFNLNKKFDFVVCIGVTGYFDSLDKLFARIYEHLKEGGVAIVCNLFNEYDIDVIVKYRNNGYFNKFESGWNIHSIKTARTELDKAGLSLTSLSKFELSFDDYPKDDPARSWTSIVDNQKKFINGLGLVYDLVCLDISK